MSARSRTDLVSSNAFRTAWTGTPVNYDIIASDPAAAPLPGRPCRAIVVGTSGTLVVTGLDGTDVTLPAMGVPWQWNIQAKALKSTSLGTNVVVLW